MTYTTLLWPMIVAAICGLLWILSGVIIMIVLRSEKKRRIKHMKKAARRRKKAMAKMSKKYPLGPSMYPPGLAPPEMVHMSTLPKMRDTPKVVPLEDDIIFDNKRKSSDIQRENSDKKQDTQQYQQWP